MLSASCLSRLSSQSCLDCAQWAAPSLLTLHMPHMCLLAWTWRHADCRARGATRSGGTGRSSRCGRPPRRQACGGRCRTPPDAFRVLLASCSGSNALGSRKDTRCSVVPLVSEHLYHPNAIDPYTGKTWTHWRWSSHWPKHVVNQRLVTAQEIVTATHVHNDAPVTIPFVS